MTHIAKDISANFGLLPQLEGTGFLRDYSDDPKFAEGIPHILHHEGRYVEDAADRGGATNWGISLRLARRLHRSSPYFDFDLDNDGDVDADDIRKLPLDKAVEVYYREFWEPQPYRFMSAAIAVKLFDLSVNMGATQANKCAQRAVRAANPNGVRLIEDGIAGPRTLDAIHAADSTRLLPAIRSEAAAIYRLIIARDGSQSRFEGGWLRRAYW